ncbi:MAG: hypothetical protein II994_00400 [Lachnospiraceae bacterium]|nr:hypothetical protein [Lachnospiraceae bacterium]
MKGFVAWWKQENRLPRLGQASLMACLPILCCLITCAVQGRSIGEVYLPTSYWNDELFYFKQVEAIVEHGYPLGYYGFNESHALKLSFAAWSPVLVFPWILWGLLFGWNLLSPVICNIVLMTVAMFAFVWLVRPTRKQMGILTLLFCLYTLFARYMLSGMPEVICFSMLIVFYGLAINYQEKETVAKLVWLFVISGLLTLMRPYMLLFLLLPVYFWVRKDKWKGLIGSGIVVSAVLVVYAMIKHYFGAEYFAPLFFTDWITAFFEKGFVGGVKNFFSTLYWMGKGFLSNTVQGFRTGLAAGAFFGGYLVTMAVLLWQTFTDWMAYRSKKREEKVKSQDGADATDKQIRAAVSQKQSVQPDKMFVIEAHLAFSFVGMLFALLLMYKLTEGSKHLLTFIAAGVFVVSMLKTKFYKKAVLLGAVFAYLYTYLAVEPYDYQVPFVEETEYAQVEAWEEYFAEGMELKTETVPNFDNVIIWVFNDETPEGLVNTKWQLLYALPNGMGISCCMRDYVLENFDTLQSRYIALPAGGEIDTMCREAGYTEIARDEDMAVYRRY